MAWLYSQADWKTYRGYFLIVRLPHRNCLRHQCTKHIRDSKALYLFQSYFFLEWNHWNWYFLILSSKFTNFHFSKFSFCSLTYQVSRLWPGIKYLLRHFSCHRYGLIIIHAWMISKSMCNVLFVRVEREYLYLSTYKTSKVP